MNGQSGIPPAVGAGLAYLLGFIGGIVMLLIEKRDRFIRFAAWQSILLSVVYFVVRILWGVLVAIIGLIPVLRTVLAPVEYLLSTLIFLAFLILWLYVTIEAFLEKEISLPVIGEMAARYAAA